MWEDSEKELSEFVSDQPHYYHSSDEECIRRRPENPLARTLLSYDDRDDYVNDNGEVDDDHDDDDPFHRPMPPSSSSGRKRTCDHHASAEMQITRKPTPDPELASKCSPDGDCWQQRRFEQEQQQWQYQQHYQYHHHHHHQQQQQQLVYASNGEMLVRGK